MIAKYYVIMYNRLFKLLVCLNICTLTRKDVLTLRHKKTEEMFINTLKTKNWLIFIKNDYLKEFMITNKEKDQ